MANAYEVRKALRQTKQRERGKIKKAQNLTARHQAELRYEEAFRLHFGKTPTVKKSLSTKTLNSLSDRLFAEMHEAELGGSDE